MGCSASKSIRSIPVSKRWSLDPTHVSPMRHSSPPSTRIVESCLVVWFCEDISNRHQNEKEYLRRMVYQLKTFDTRDLCHSFISHTVDEKIFLIISDQHQSTAGFEHLPQIEKFYFFHSSGPEQDEMKDIVVQNMDDLLQQIQEDIELCEADLISITSIPSSSREIILSSHIPAQEASFLWAQAMKDVIYRFKFETGSKDVLVDCCRTYYSNNEHQLRLIEEFDNKYRPNQALWWLINPCFISKMLHRTQRTFEVDIIYKLGFFIKQVNMQLTRLSEENLSLVKHVSTVYRGKAMSTNDFQTLVTNIDGGLLSFNNFLISSVKKESAVDFIRRRLNLHPDMIGVLFEIEINPKRRQGGSPFALIKETHIEKDQICFDLSTIFHIESIVQMTDPSPAMWVVKLRLLNDDGDQQLNRLLTSIRTNELYPNPIPFIGKLLIDMGEYRRAEKCFLGLLKDISILSQPRRLTRVHDGLGAIYMHRDEYRKALEHYQQVLQTSLIYLPPDHLDLVPVYKAIGDSHWNERNYLSATENYEKAIALLEPNASQSHRDILIDLHFRLDKAKKSIPNKME